jgi:hypothetical protein
VAICRPISGGDNPFEIGISRNPFEGRLRTMYYCPNRPIFGYRTYGFRSQEGYIYIVLLRI